LFVALAVNEHGLAVQVNVSQQEAGQLLDPKTGLQGQL
jgi:hypothetical protein